MRLGSSAVRGGLFFSLLISIASGQSGPADPFDKDAFLSLKKWYLTFELTLKGGGNVERPDGSGGTLATTWTIDRELSGEVVLDGVRPGDGPAQLTTPLDPKAPHGGRVGRFITWSATDPSGKSVTYRINDQVRNEIRSVGEGGVRTKDWDVLRVEDTGVLALARADDRFGFACDLVDLNFDVSLSTILNGLGGGGQFPRTVKVTGENSRNSPTVLPPQSAKPGPLLPQAALPRGGETLWPTLLGRKLELRDGKIGFTASVPITQLPEPYHFTVDAGAALELSLKVAVLPGPPSHAKLILTPQGYETWRPKCSNSEAVKGNELKVDWRVEDDGGGGAVPPKVTRVVCSLQNTSREPGVCLNFPLHPKIPADFDLMFEASKSLARGSVTSTDRQTLTLSDTLASAGHGTVTIESFDSGGWSDLSVTADLDDGRTITGHLKDNATDPVVSLPKRAHGSKIADGWKTDHGVSAPDDDDSEPSPSAGKPPGDGFTLYEEYRGFYENGKFVEGDPKKIDFFVRNFIGGDARPGIDLFARLTGAEVHDQLGNAEFDPAKRVMNANHAQGAHRADQHGVFLRTEAGLDGAFARFTTNRLRGRPRLCTGIFVQPRGAQTPTSTSENVPVSDLVFIYDQFVAHELLHSVGVDHHGERDYYMTPTLVFSDSPVNKTGQAYFEVSGKVVSIVDETSGRDLAVKLEPDLLVARETFRPAFARFQEKNTAEEFEVLLNLFFGTYTWYVGAQHGQCSGEEGCVTRYYFAKLYEKKGVANAYYYIGDKETERAGLILCHARTGSGINAAGRKPQARYGDSNPGWGDCADWIVFNDAAPDEAAPKP